MEQITVRNYVFQFIIAFPVKWPKLPQLTKSSLTQVRGMKNTTKTKANKTTNYFLAQSILIYIIQLKISMAWFQTSYIEDFKSHCKLWANMVI